ncbi:uncharacterized protein LOC124815107 isoform X1 [Hydra vulgaris]|uniref:uncharacterized protein LOC124815107 isoform X1 n=1 Tax=Hydra vulgaris TaxID=6087 RepID=UPI001F5F848A|nr:uncharacterized protein LOC124815107 isoform X1 [Hydra vulgaris]XP_047139228.1 uncharacterized protein LOC124815107 isoform X1 [Hydra vulgaris]
MQDLENIIPLEAFQAVLNSEFCVKVTTKAKTIYGMEINHLKMRDSIFFSLIINNMSRSGAVSNMTIDEYLKGTYTLTKSFIVLVKKHKTARKYGPCQIVINEELKLLCDCYWKIFRNQIPGKKSLNLFVTWSGCDLESGSVSTQLNSFFTKCLPDDSCDKRSCATLVWKSLLTFFYDNHPEIKSELATLMKHKKETGERWYYLNQKNKEVSEVSEKVGKIIFGRNDTRVSDSCNLLQNVPTSSSKTIQDSRSQCSSIDSNEENDSDKEY